MSLKTDYFDGVTGLHQKMDAAFAAGAAFVATNSVALSAALKDNAQKGLTKFTVSFDTSDNPAYFRNNAGDNLYKKSYFDGIVSALMDQNIYTYECTLALDLSDTVIVTIDLNFAFETS